MKYAIVGVMAFLVAAFPGVVVPGYGDCGPSVGKIEALSQPLSRAIGVVKRDAGVEGRYVVEAIEGTFRPGARVSVLTPGGDLVARGTVHSVYDEESYVDAAPEAGASIGTGFPVLMSYPDGEAAAAVQARSVPLKAAATDIRQENAQLEQEIARDERRDEKERVKWQEEMTRLNKELDFQYYATYYSWRYPAFWSW